MFNFVSLKVKCPHCGTPFMDEEHPIDNLPSIKLSIKHNGQKGFIRLSSIYGSYNIDTDIEVKENEVAEFSCPHCAKILTSQELCSVCGAPLVDFNLAEGGMVSICSRAGCKKHNVEFEDLSTALAHFYEDFAYRGQQTPDVKDSLNNLPIAEDDQMENKAIIESGTYLHSFCPYCRKSLNDHDMLKLKIEKENGETGFLMLSPYLNVFTHKSTIQLPEQTSVKGVKCWHCDHSLKVEEEPCPKCGSELIRIQVATFTKMADFYICSKKGCTWHGLSDEDLNSIILEDSKEW